MIYFNINWYPNLKVSWFMLFNKLFTSRETFLFFSVHFKCLSQPSSVDWMSRHGHDIWRTCIIHMTQAGARPVGDPGQCFCLTLTSPCVCWWPLWFFSCASFLQGLGFWHLLLNTGVLCSTCVCLLLIRVGNMIDVLSFVCPVVSLFPHLVLVAVWAFYVIYHPTLCRF